MGGGDHRRCRRQQIVDFARLYGRTKRSFIRVGYGFSRSRNGAAQLFMR